MKYSVNHRWKFDNYKLAFLPGFLQVIAMVVITLINFVVIMISNSILDIAKDFTALMIISDFDNIFGQFEGSDELPKKILNDDEYESLLFTVEKTSSRKAALDGNGPRSSVENAKVEEEKWILDKVNDRRTKARRVQRKFNQEPPRKCCGCLRCCRPKTVNWKTNIELPKSFSLQPHQRTRENLLLYYVYRVFRISHVAIWFYALPFIVQFVMYYEALKRSFGQTCYEDTAYLCEKEPVEGVGGNTFD